MNGKVKAAFLIVVILTSNLSFYGQSIILGTVTNMEMSAPFQYVTVNAVGNVSYVTETDSMGNYTMEVDTGSYEMLFVKYGYDTVIVNVYVDENTQVTQDVEMYMYPYPPRNVTCELIWNTCYIDFTPPITADEIIYDDGSFESVFYWETGDGYLVQKFTPVTYPVKVTGCRINVGDGNVPPNTYFLGHELHVVIIDDDGVDGLPGTIIGNCDYQINNYFWVDFTDCFDCEILEGSYYMGFIQNYSCYGSPPITIDTTGICENRSYWKYAEGWKRDTTGNYLIRSMVEDYGAKSKELIGYTTALVRDINPCIYPVGVTLTPIAGTSYEFLGGPPNYFFAGAVQAVYNQNQSDWVYSNIIPPKGDVEVVFDITTCNQGSVDSSLVKLYGSTYGFTDYFVYCDSSGYGVIDTLNSDTFRIVVSQPGYLNYVDTISISIDTTINIELTESIYPPYNVLVDSMTNMLSWNKPTVGLVQCETFEDELFPPEGWYAWNGVAPNYGYSWWRDDDLALDFFVVPPGDGYYAVATTDWGSAGLHPLDFLMTPQLDLSNLDSYKLTFDNYYTGGFGQSGYVEYSFDGGIIWDTIAEMEPSSGWSKVNVDLSFLSGQQSDSVYFVFHSSDHNEWGSGWAIDNVSIIADTLDVVGYNISLNGLLVDQVGPDITTYFFDNLEYDRNYIACVNAIYGCGESEYRCASWNSGFLQPVRDLNDSYVSGNYNLNLHWLPPCVTNTDSIPAGLVAFNLYMNNVKVDSFPYFGQQPGETIAYDFDSLVPGSYLFDIEACYDLTSYGFPDQYAVSARESTDTIVVAWGESIPFIETWDTKNENIWIFDDSITNWSISDDDGNPAPSAKFYWQPHQQDVYETSLTSSFIRADSLTEGAVILKFDLKLRDRNITGNENLLVELKSGNEWVEIASFSNNGTVFFTTFEYDITSLVINSIFQIRFRATGVNSKDILAWYIDNIIIDRECIAPENLMANVDWFTHNNPAIKLSWENPFYDSTGGWRHWDNDSVGVNSLGLSAGGVFEVASFWNPEQLQFPNGGIIDTVKYFIADEFISIKIKIWDGENASNLIYEYDVTDITEANKWNIYSLDNPVFISGMEDVQVGYEIEHSSGSSPGGGDSGSAIAGYGDMFCDDGNYWCPISDFGYDYNWSIRFHVSSNVGSPERKYFNIYRMENNSAQDYYLYDSVESVSINEIMSYYDTVPNVDLQEGYFYKVAAVSISSYEVCESLPAKSKLNPNEDFVYVFLEEVNALLNNYELNIYPNPAKEIINIECGTIIKNVSLYNISGIRIADKSFNDLHSSMSLLNIPQGLYMLFVETENGSFVRKVVIMK